MLGESLLAAAPLAAEAAAGGADLREIIQAFVIGVLLPVGLGMCWWLARQGKGGQALATFVGVLIALAGAFGSSATWQGVGETVTQAIDNMLSWRV